MHAKRMQVTCIVLKREILGNKKKKDSKRKENRKRKQKDGSNATPTTNPNESV